MLRLAQNIGASPRSGRRKYKKREQYRAQSRGVRSRLLQQTQYRKKGSFRWGGRDLHWEKRSWEGGRKRSRHEVARGDQWSRPSDDAPLIKQVYPTPRKRSGKIKHRNNRPGTGKTEKKTQIERHARRQGGRTRDAVAQVSVKKKDPEINGQKNMVKETEEDGGT